MGSRKGTSLRFFDFEAFLGEVDRQATKRGIRKDKPCIAYDEVIALKEQRLEAVSVCDNSSEYLFFDLIHPTTIVHKALANALAAELG